MSIHVRLPELCVTVFPLRLSATLGLLIAVAVSAHAAPDRPIAASDGSHDVGTIHQAAESTPPEPDDVRPDVGPETPALARPRQVGSGTFTGRMRVVTGCDLQGGRTSTDLWLDTPDGRYRLDFHGGPSPAARAGARLTVEGDVSGERLTVRRLVRMEQPEVPLTGSCPFSIGQQKIAVILVGFPNDPPATTRALARDFFFGTATGRSVDGFWRDASYGLLSATGDVFPPPSSPNEYYAIPQGYDCQHLSNLSNAVVAAADADIDFTQYTQMFIIYPFFTGGGCHAGDAFGCMEHTSSGEGQFTIATAFIIDNQIYSREQGAQTSAHEGGHLMGLHHASAFTYGSEVIGPPAAPFMDIDTYLDPFSDMGQHSIGHYAAPHKAQLGWLDSAHVQTVASDDTYMLFPYETLPASGNVALKVPRGTDTGWIWLESRTNLGYDSYFNEHRGWTGAILHYEPSLGSPFTYMLDMTPGNNLGYGDGELNPGMTWTDPYTGLSLHAEQAAGALAITASFASGVCAQHPPQVLLTPDGRGTVNGATFPGTISITNTNTNCADAEYELTTDIPLGITLSPAPPLQSQHVILSSGETWMFNTTVSVSQTIASGTYPVNFSVRGGGGTVSDSLTIIVDSHCAVADVAIAPHAQSAVNGESFPATITVTNRDSASCQNSTFDLGVALPPGFTMSPPPPAQVTVSPGAVNTIDTTVAIAPVVPTGSYPLAVTMSGQRTGNASDTLTVGVTSSCTLANPTVDLQPNTLNAPWNEPAVFTLAVTAGDVGGCGSHWFRVSTPTPVGWPSTLSSAACFKLGPGGVKNFTLTKTIPGPDLVGQTFTVDAIATSLPYATGNPCTSFASEAARAVIDDPGSGEGEGGTSNQQQSYEGSDASTLTVVGMCTRANPTVVLSPHAAPVNAGDPAPLTVTVTSNDSAACTPKPFSLTSTVPAGWQKTLSPGSLTLGPGQQGTSTFVATPPVTHAGGTATVSVTASMSANGTTYRSTDSSTVTVAAVCRRSYALATFQPDTLSVDAGSTAWFTVTVTNADAGALCTTQHFNLVVSPPGGWDDTVTPDALDLAPGESRDISYAATPPASTPGGAYTVGLQVAGNPDGGAGAATVNVRAVCLRGSGPIVTLSPSQITVSAGTTASFTVTVQDTDVGAACTGYSVDLVSTQPTGFSHTLSPSGLFLAPHATATATLTERPPLTHPGGSAVVTVSALRGNTIGDDSTGGATLTVTPVCVRSTPTVTITPASVTVEAGAGAAYTITVTNRDSAPCGSSIFSFSASVPATWGLWFTNYNLSISPGGSGSSVMTRTPPISTAPGVYTVDGTAGSSSSGSATATAQCQVTAPQLHVDLSVSGTSFPRNTTIPITATTHYGGVLQSGVAVHYTLTLPNGSTKTFNATSSSSGTAVWNYKVTSAGNYSVIATASWSGKTATSNTVTFTVN